MARGTASHTDGDVRQRLLEAAGEEFARHGFENASVRAMCDRAEANVSAVKYHFGSKEELYSSVWRAAVERTTNYRSIPTYDPQTQTPEEALGEFIAWFVDLMLYRDVRFTPSLGHLLSHEMISPTPGGIDLFMEKCAGPMHGSLRQMVRAMIGQEVPEATMRRLCNHVVALCVHPHQSREIQNRVGVPVPKSKPALKKLADDITTFATAGIKAFAAP
ncbi:MAG: CerR family C-terminal domain-containing protein [Planctomycetota bacterium]